MVSKTKAYISLLFFSLVLLSIGCRNNTQATHAVKKVPVASAIVHNAIPKADTTKWPDTPDFPAHYKPLLSFFERYKALSTFDTTIDFSDQGFGAADGYDAFIEAGHLFSPKQTTALLFYDVCLKMYQPVARMAVFKKGLQTGWQKVLDDTLDDVGEAYLRYVDWNNDGILDLCLLIDGWHHGGHGPISWRVWLVDKEGHLHKVKGFEDLDDPQIDSFTHHIFSNTESRDGGEYMGEYKFSGNRIIYLRDMYTPYDTPVVYYYRNKKFLKKIHLKAGEQLYTPKYLDIP